MLPHIIPRDGFDTNSFNLADIINLLCFGLKIFYRQVWHCSWRMQHQQAIRNKIWIVNYFFEKHQFSLFTKLTVLWLAPWPLSKSRLVHQKKKLRRSFFSNNFKGGKSSSQFRWFTIAKIELLFLMFFVLILGLRLQRYSTNTKRYPPKKVFGNSEFCSSRQNHSSLNY